MNAPNSTQVQRLLADPRFYEALEEFKRRLAKSSGRAQAGAEASAMMHGFIDKLPTLLADAVTPPAFWQEKWQKTYTRMTGQTKKQRNKFPGQIRIMAARMENLNRSLFFAPRRDDDRDYFGKLHALPDALRWYAAWVESQSEKNLPS